MGIRQFAGQIKVRPHKHMLELLRDAVWQFIGATLTAVGLLLAIVLALPQFRRKKLSSYTRSTPVVRVQMGFSSAFKLTFNGTPIDAAAVVSLRIWNSGQIPIVPSDFAEQLRLQFAKDARILEASVVSSEPPELAGAAQLQVSDAAATEVPAVVIAPTLFNPGDSLDLAVLVTTTEVPKLTGRIAGVKTITASNPFDPRLGPLTASAWKQFVFALGLGIAASISAELLRKLL
jgi:hypothetical protein